MKILWKRIFGALFGRRSVKHDVPIIGTKDNVGRNKTSLRVGRLSLPKQKKKGIPYETMTREQKIEYGFFWKAREGEEDDAI